MMMELLNDASPVYVPVSDTIMFGLGSKGEDDRVFGL
jgi:hypothetical protein